MLPHAAWCRLGECTRAAGSCLDPFGPHFHFWHPQCSGAQPMWALSQQQPMKLLLGCFMDEGDSLLPFPCYSGFAWATWHPSSGGLSWSLQALPIPVCHFSLAGYTLRLKEDCVQHSRHVCDGFYIVFNSRIFTVVVLNL